METPRLRLHGKRCFVSAAGQGIGRSIAESFAREGAEVIAADIRFDDASFPGATETLLLDVTDDAAAARAAPGSRSTRAR